MFDDQIILYKYNLIIPSILKYYSDTKYGYAIKNKTNKKILLISHYNETINYVLDTYGEYSSYELLDKIKKDPYFIDLIEKGYNDINMYLKTHIKPYKNKKYIKGRKENGRI